MKTLKRVVTYLFEYSLGTGLALSPIPINLIYGTSLYVLAPITVLGVLIVIRAAWNVSLEEE